MAPKEVLWRRWRLPLPLAVVPTAPVTWLVINAAPYLEPFNAGWWAFVVGGVLFACLAFLWYLVDRHTEAMIGALTPSADASAYGSTHP